MAAATADMSDSEWDRVEGSDGGDGSDSDDLEAMEAELRALQAEGATEGTGSKGASQCLQGPASPAWDEPKSQACTVSKCYVSKRLWP